MSKGNKILKSSKKILRFLGLIFIALFISINLFILLSGRFYLYKGISYTYLSGKTGPTIYDLHVFPSSTIKKSKSCYQWKKNAKFNTQSIPKKYNDFLLKLDTKALLVFKGDEILFEKYWGQHKKETVSNCFSAAKTVVSLLIGAALDEGKIKSLDEKVGKYIPEFNAGKKKNITIRHLLMMSSGLDWQESGKNPLSENAESYYGTDLYGLVTRQHVIEKPGIRFEYQSGNSQLLGYVLEKATQMDLSVYAQKKIWDKIGAEHNAFWSLDKDGGDEKAFCCMYATARDFGRLGKLILQKGKWNGKQIISSTYMNEMLSNPSMTTKEKVPNLRYGLHIWTYLGTKNPVYYCRGILGQYIISIPNENLVIIRLGSKRGKEYAIPEAYRGDEKYIKNHATKLGHPSDLFEIISLGQKLAKDIQN
jgi:CubicO group peptidase (beta-lactamase class C family)